MPACSRETRSSTLALPGCAGPRSRVCDRRHLLLGGLAVLGMGPVLAAAPHEVVRLVVPFAVGGTSDALARTLARVLCEVLGAVVVVDNVSGATGQRAAMQVAHSAGDGRTLLLGTSTSHAIAPTLFPKLPYRPERDFKTIGAVARTRIVIVAHPALPARTLRELAVHARSQPQPLLYGSWGIGSGGHLALQTIALQSGLRLEHVPFQGVAPMLQSLLAGQIPLGTGDSSAVLPLVNAGKVAAVAISGRSRMSALPRTATFEESGLHFPADSWFALFAPSSLDTAAQHRLETALAAAVRHTDVVNALHALALEPVTLDRASFEKQWREDIEHWRHVTRQAGITLE